MRCSIRSIIGPAAVGLLMSSVVGNSVYAATTPPSPPAIASPVSATPTAPPTDVVDLNNQSQSNIAMAQMLFKLGQLQGQLAGLRQQDAAKAIDDANLKEQLKVAQGRVADLSRPRCDGAAYLSHSAPVPVQSGRPMTPAQRSVIVPSHK